MKVIFKIVFVLICCVSLNTSAQEYLKPLSGNIDLFYNNPVNQPQKNSTQKVAAVSDTIPFFEDFFYAPNSPYPTGKHWTDSSVYINTGFAIAPPSIGVATFDGLNKKGYPYNMSATAIVSAPADTLSSRPINLFTNTLATYTYSPADSLGISFLYQAKGFGENPAVNDSLVLDFYKPLANVWVRGWFTRGNNSPPANDTMFKKVFVRIKDTAYFHDGFRFRLRNKATGSGSSDHWHVDYISLKTNHFKTDTSYNDVTFGYMPRPILKNYSSMPFNQYQASEMGTKFSNFIRNNNVGIVKNTNYEYSIYSSAMTLLDAYGTGAGNTGNVNPFVTRGWDSVLTHKNPPINYTINPLPDSTFFIIKHIVNTNPDTWKYNDTIVQKLEFNNFYAYDDGSAESAYYHNTYGAKDGIKFVLNVTDTLRALDIFFDPFIDGNIIKNSQFRMYVWADGGGQPGTVIRKDSAMKPIYLDHGYNKIPRYFFTSSMILSAGTYYIGMQQVTNQPLYVGFDRNVDHKSSLYYDTGSGWTQSAIKGSLMIHPVFGEATRALVGIKEQEKIKSKEGFIKVYPNPASDKLFITAEKINTKDKYTIELYSMMGSKLNEVRLENTTTEIDLDAYASGIYFVVLKQNNSTIANQKFIISH
ncbi:MAG: T9SS type A sorting domain-containing protein [Sphingobacteriaceae bacterium]|nr:T9SS type A sorting domain-containing protein [Sphingobacteriaceae bacterium]